ncbi:ArsR/SmtB family transcription factor [Caldisericum exile]|uniref:ArsR family transcriptional regulator n=1 Tax=Caldisericum exile (strain DSM 21853 / NBRC 104410 / AZM16c01) TaxID=511051 RepID=A0A7U6GDF1_CALEA|nr:metalloregulator ArsR/SmtB family transcription factor [Caldisericum exile]BAL80368.1 ArsR family transcriptional regulator [Caldisericum exile AZM16c01]
MSKYDSIFKAIGDEKRLKLLLLIIKGGKEYYVCELTYAMGENQYNISKYLRELKLAGLLKERKIGRGVLYSLENGDEFNNRLFALLNGIPNEYIKDAIIRLNYVVSNRANDQCVNIAKLDNIKSKFN